MGITVTWDNDDRTVIRQIYEGDWDIADYYQAVMTTQRLAGEIDHPFDLILDLTRARRSSISLLSAARRVENNVPPNRRRAVVVRADAYLKAIIQVGRRIAPRAGSEVYFADTLDDARALIAGWSRTTPASVTPG
jgi:hypothetical protein